MTQNLTAQSDGNDAVWQALNRSQAIITFDPQGRVLEANANFLKLMGYTLDEIVGEHHRIFCTLEESNSAEYRLFWKKLEHSEFQTGEYQRLAKDGHKVWLRASYNPILDNQGQVRKIVKFATDVTADKKRNGEIVGKPIALDRLIALDRSQAVVEFDTEGNVLTANKNFLAALGYQLDDIVGRHHRMFCDPDYAASDAYREFWARLGRGEFIVDEFKRLGQDGHEAWIQATYTPIVDAAGRVYKVVKFATDITEQKHRNIEFKGKVEAIMRSQAVIEFDLKGTILAANSNFLNTMGYQADELIGQHHRILCEPDYVASREYRDFWLALARGGFFADRFKRIGRFGNAVWIRATYNPIFNADGEPYKVVKYATDITEQVEREEQIQRQAKKMTTSVAELNTSIASIAENTNIARDLARTTQGESRQGGKAVANSVEAMQAIKKSSKDIEEIIKVIGEIASQTNLLAFNAAIEAARAGESGLGFSVVADEVRRLAEKSADATRQINRLLDESLERIGSGMTVCGEAHDAFKRITEGVEQTTRSVEGIASTTEAQVGTANHVDELIRALTGTTTPAEKPVEAGKRPTIAAAG